MFGEIGADGTSEVTSRPSTSIWSFVCMNSDMSSQVISPAEPFATVWPIAAELPLIIADMDLSVLG